MELYVGIDWATEEHQVSIADGSGKEVERRRVRHDGEEIERFVSELAKRAANGDMITVAIEPTSTALIDAMLERKIAVYTLNPKQLDRFRDRHTVAGAKDDRRDAYVLADSVRTDKKLFRPLELDEPLLLELREVSRAREEVGDELIALSNRLTGLVRRYFPQVLELGSLYQDRWLLDLFELAPSPAAVKHLQRAKVTAHLASAKVRRLSADDVLKTLRKRDVPVAPGVTEAALAHVHMLLPRLKVALQQKSWANKRLAELLDELQKPEEAGAGGDATTSKEAGADDSTQPKKHRDATILLSLPGAGPIVGATMLTEASRALAARDYQALRGLCGVAPVTSQTGKQQQGRSQGKPLPKPLILMRRACNRRLRDIVHAWAGIAYQFDPRLYALYTKMRARGLSYARTMRGIGDRLLSMLVAMLETNTLYDETKRVSEAAPPRKRRAASAKQKHGVAQPAAA